MFGFLRTRALIKKWEMGEGMGGDRDHLYTLSVFLLILFVCSDHELPFSDICSTAIVT